MQSPPRKAPPLEDVDLEEIDRHRAASRAVTLAVYREWGLLGDEDEALVRVLMGEVAMPPPPADVGLRAARLLSGLLDAIELVDHPNEGPEVLAGPYGRFTQALSAVQIAAALDPVEAEEWRERALDRVLGKGVAEARRLRELARCRLEDVRAVIVGPVVRPSGTWVSSVELYADGWIINWRTPYERPAGPTLVPLPTPKVAVSDDLATEYVLASGSAGYGAMPKSLSGMSGFAPAPPADARELSVEIGSDGFTVVLSAAGGAIR